MPSFDELVRRVAADPDFAERVRTDPRGALAGSDLSDDELRRLDHVLRPTRPADRPGAPAPDGSAGAGAVGDRDATGHDGR